MLGCPLIHNVGWNPRSAQRRCDLASVDILRDHGLQRRDVGLVCGVGGGDLSGNLQLLPDMSGQIFVGGFPSAHWIAKDQPVPGQGVPHRIRAIPQELAHTLKVQPSGLVHHNAHRVGGVGDVPLGFRSRQAAAENGRRFPGLLRPVKDFQCPEQSAVWALLQQLRVRRKVQLPV